MNKDEIIEELERMINACDKTGLADFQAVIIKRSTAEAIIKLLREENTKEVGMLEKYFVANRGSGKSVTEYFCGLHRLYLDKKIPFENYIYMLSTARIMLCGSNEDEVCNWAEETLEQGEEAYRNYNFPTKPFISTLIEKIDNA